MFKTNSTISIFDHILRFSREYPNFVLKNLLKMVSNFHDSLQSLSIFTSQKMRSKIYSRFAVINEALWEVDQIWLQISDEIKFWEGSNNNTIRFSCVGAHQIMWNETIYATRVYRFSFYLQRMLVQFAVRSKKKNQLNIETT